MSKNVMRLLDRSLGLMECRICGYRHFAGLGGGGNHIRRVWECQNGCRLENNRSATRPKNERASATGA